MKDTSQRTLKFIRETDLARLYENDRGTQLWIPRSVCPSTRKLPRESGTPVHVVESEDWWLEKNPWPAGQQSLL